MKISFNPNVTADPVTEVFINSEMAELHNHTFTFTDDKVNVIIGKNGSGKSSFIKMLAYFSCSFLEGTTRIKSAIRNYDYDRVYQIINNRAKFMPAILAEDMPASAMYYGAGFQIGNDPLTHAMMCGFSAQVKAALPFVDKVSEGEKAKYFLNPIVDVIENRGAVPDIAMPEDTAEVLAQAQYCWGSFVSHDKMKQALYSDFNSRNSSKKLILLDEPDLYLDVDAQIRLWRALSSFQKKGHIVIVATHSIIPCLYSEKFNVIEASEGHLSKNKLLATSFL